jgi:cyclic beta-1,2-glucan synthetase
MERFARYEPGVESGSLYRHCLRAIRCGATAGPHGLPLIGSGDWNDGLNRVGIKGRGESVWLGWFLYATLTRFAPLCEKYGDLAAADQLRQQAEALRSKLEEHAWDGEWYRRAYFDDGTPLGSSDSPECRIDLTAQTWAVMSGGARRDRQQVAMQSVNRLLVRDEDRLVLLLTPPFDTADWDPGYIKGYPPGVRENGGQYTHAAVWAGWAFAELGDGDRAWQLFDFLNPVRRHDSPETSERYRVEPYVMPGDVYSEPPHVGRGGWTWYSGSASWMYRLGIEAILGLRLVGDGFEINPCIPRQWPGFQAMVRRNGARYDIRVDNTAGAGGGVAEVQIDGEPVDDGVVRWRDDHERHRVTVHLDGRSADLAP